MVKDISRAGTHRGRRLLKLDALKLNRSVWVFLLAGVALRCTALQQPLIDAQLVRQCQTAAATESLINQRGFNLSSGVPWSGDIGDRILQELPIYNYLVIGVDRVIGNLDESAKVTTILLWAISFLCLQFIWRRLLDRQQTIWANLLFVVAPLEVFFGQAFMPEMLVQLLAFSFVLLTIRYIESPTLIQWIACVLVGLTGLLVKPTEIAHLYLILLPLVFTRERFKALLRPRYLIAAAVTIVALKMWTDYADTVNVGPLSLGSSQERLLNTYIGISNSRFDFKPWAMVGLYLTAFIASGPAALIIGYGLWIFLRRPGNRILGLWLLSLLFFYLLWFGYAATNHSYYNLPAVAPLCALFGIGMRKLLSTEYFIRWRRMATIGAVLLVVLPSVPLWLYLFQQDRQIFAAACWVRANTQPDDVILFRPNHRSDMIDYPFNPVLAYYGKRPTFVWTKFTPEAYRKAALGRARYAVVTLPEPADAGMFALVRHFRHSHRSPESMDWLESSGFRILVPEKDFIVYIRNQP